LQLFLSGRAAKIFVGTIVNHQTKPQRGDNFKKVSQVNAFITSNSFFPDNSDYFNDISESAKHPNA
jgi:hypothetical protein